MVSYAILTLLLSGTEADKKEPDTIIPVKTYSYTMQEVSQFYSNIDNQDEIDISDEVKETEQITLELRNKLLGLEMFLTDKSLYEKFCYPQISWTQPELCDYQKEPKSNLPKECLDLIVDTENQKNNN